MSEMTLRMPNRYVCVEKDEMEYVDGGVWAELRWYGFDLYLSHNERVTVTDIQIVVGGVLGVFSFGAATAIVGIIGGVMWNHDEGNGIICRFTTIPFPSMIGVSAR